MVLKSVWLEMRWQNFWWNQIFFHPAGLSIRRKWVRHGSPMLTEGSVTYTGSEMANRVMAA